MRQRYSLRPGHELRGFVIRLYPDDSAVRWMREQQSKLLIAWNWLISQSRERDAAVEAMAIREGLVPPRPVCPDYDGMAPEVASAAKIAHRDAVRAWYLQLRKATKKDPRCAYRTLKEWQEHLGCAWDYQLLQKVITWRCPDGASVPGASMLQALVKNYFTKSDRPKRFKKRPEEMPLQVRTGACFSLGSFGGRGANPDFYNCQVSFGRTKIRGRLPGMIPGGRVLEGVTVRCEAGRWFASVKVEVPERVLPEPVVGSVVGIDVGLDNMAAMWGDGLQELVVNTRGIELNERIAKLQHHADICDGTETAARLRQRAARLNQKASWHVRHKIYNEILKPLALVETIKVENLNSKIGQMGSKKVSVMRLIYRLLVERYGDRVREVDCAFTSQDCSQCGTRDKESWSYGRGPIGQCVHCGHEMHRDINAARNIASRPALPHEKAA